MSAVDKREILALVVDSGLPRRNQPVKVRLKTDKSTTSVVHKARQKQAQPLRTKQIDGELKSKTP